MRHPEDCADRGADAEIGDGFEFVALGEKGQELAWDAWLSLRQSAELASEAAMRFGSLASWVENAVFGRKSDRANRPCLDAEHPVPIKGY